MEPEHTSEETLDLLKELDSIESMVAGIEQAGTGERAGSTGSTPEASADDLEDEALKLLEQLDVPQDDMTPEPPAAAVKDETQAPEGPPARESISESESQAIKKKMERLNQMEEQMMEELLKLKAEREQLKADLKV
jgi:hypothetical protein